MLHRHPEQNAEHHAEDPAMADEQCPTLLPGCVVGIAQDLIAIEGPGFATFREVGQQFRERGLDATSDCVQALSATCMRLRRPSAPVPESVAETLRDLAVGEAFPLSLRNLQQPGLGSERWNRAPRL